ncbi:MAG: hypothetical protein H6739_22195 [Alphaproteobacteria bacterium]|nr:hypothetical protein [Alphaproteobacteria bacterium]
MNGKSSSPRAFPVEDFIQALIHQLDNVQDALALKVKTGRPLTWALKDLSLDLKVFVEVDPRGTVTLRSAGPNEEGASTVHITLSTITRPMIEENTYAFEADTDPRSLDELGASAGLSDEQLRKLRVLGVRTAGQFRKLAESENQRAVQAQSGIPVNDLMRALQASSRPTVTGHSVERDRDGRPVVRIQGANLFDGVTPEVRLAGEPVEVLNARPSELIVRPMGHQREGQVEVLVGGRRCTGWFNVADTPRGYSAAMDSDPWADIGPSGGER